MNKEKILFNTKNQIFHNIGIKSSSFDRTQKDLALSHSLYRYDVIAKGNKTIHKYC